MWKLYFPKRQEITLVCVARIDRPNPIESEWVEQTLGRTAIESLILQLSDAARKGRARRWKRRRAIQTAGMLYVMGWRQSLKKCAVLGEAYRYL